MSKYEILELPLKFDLEDKTILKQASLAHRQLAELKGVARTIPNENILISTLTLQEAKDSSEVESIVTTQDDLYRYEIKAENFEKLPASKEVLKYREAIRTGFEKLRKGLPLTSNLIQEVQSVLIGNTAGFRKVPGTELRDNFGNVIYQPPQDCCSVHEQPRGVRQSSGNGGLGSSRQIGGHPSPVRKHPSVLRWQRTNRTNRLYFVSGCERPVGLADFVFKPLYHPEQDRVLPSAAGGERQQWCRRGLAGVGHVHAERHRGDGDAHDYDCQWHQSADGGV